MIVMIGILVVFLVSIIFVVKKDSDGAIVSFVLSSAVLIISIIIICAANLFPEARKIVWEEKRKAIVYEMEHGFYVGDSLGEYNATLKNMQRLNKNPWINWFVGDYIMDIEPIGLEER